MRIDIAICDDERRQAEYIKSLVSLWAGDNDLDVRTEIYGSAESFASARAGGKKFDILLLDIQMGGQSGMELAREIRRTDAKLVIIFITGFADYMPEGYDVSALHYLVKPIDEKKFVAVLDKAVKSLETNNKSLALAIGGETHYVPLSEIRYIEAQGHYVIIQAVSREYRQKMNLTQIVELLDNRFFRCQRSFIVNLSFVYKISRTFITLDNKTEVPISRNLYEAANRAVIKFFPGE